MDVNKLEMLMKCPVSTDVEHRVSLLAKCLYDILTNADTECSSSTAASSGSSDGSEVSRTVGMFMTAHGTWLMQQWQQITRHFDNRYVVSCSPM